ncbi:hypothetical protein MKQ70_32285 [Chitinophaga sedimenti]|uniref:hypothetical protein n=1 Tax=Chitinophaga sedimenti TaxID=2033606 RepID=UPI00200363B8|nr:hypothetical protein [Chitinophaga sedimenti]MCK7559396.1 hypothetical protein [Chitinophaga sedimenti]
MSVIPNITLTGDPLLSITAGMAYHEIGMYIDAQYYLAKGLYRPEIDRNLKLSAEWATVINDYNLYRYNRREFIDHLIRLRTEYFDLVKGDLAIDLYIQKYKILEEPVEVLQAENTELTIEENDRKIVRSKLKAGEKLMLQVMNAENYGRYLQRLREQQCIAAENQFALDGTPDIENLLAQSHLIDTKMSSFQGKILSLGQQASKYNNAFVEAESYAILGGIHLNIELALLALEGWNHAMLHDDHEQIMANHINLISRASMLFAQEGYLGRSYQQICNAIELIHISEFYKFKPVFDKPSLRDAMVGLEQKLQLRPYTFQAVELIKARNKNRAVSNNP